MRWAGMRIIPALLLALLALPALAQEAEVPLPKPRPIETPQSGATPPPAAENSEPAEPAEPATKLPRPRPDPDAPRPEAPPETPGPAGEAAPPADPTEHVEAPPAEPEAPPRIYQSACPAVIAGVVEAELLPPIEDGQCRAQSPLSLSGVMANGRMLPLTGGVVTTCGMASAMPSWVASIDAYLFAKENTRIEAVIVGTSYMCRNVNNAAEGSLSFHAFADALDVVGFKLEDGRTVTVEGGWSDARSPEGRLLRFAHDSACAHFTTTLGPEANALHRDHLHLDLGCHGKTCTARLCE